MRANFEKYFKDVGFSWGVMILNKFFFVFIILYFCDIGNLLENFFLFPFGGTIGQGIG